MYQNILTSEHGDGALRAAIITLHRPKQLNALNDELMDELSDTLRRTIPETISALDY